MVLSFIENAPQILSSFMLLASAFLIYALRKIDRRIEWSYIMLALSFLAIGISFGLLNKFFGIEAIELIRSLFLMFSGLVFAYSIASLELKERKAGI